MHILAGVTILLAFAMHGMLWAGLRGPEPVRERAVRLAHRIWWGVAAATCALAAGSLAMNSELVERFANAPGGAIFPVIGLAGLLGVFLCKAPETEALAFLSSWSFLAGAIGSAAFGA